MPYYTYHCPSCGREDDVLQTHREMQERRDSMRCVACEGQMQFVFPAPKCVTDTTYVASLGDTWANQHPGLRKKAIRDARRLGINPDSHTYIPMFAGREKTAGPDGWVPHDRARETIKQRCEEMGVDCDGGVKHKATVRDVPDDPQPYTVAEDLVQDHVDLEVEKHGGDVTPSERVEIADKFREQASGR